MAVKNTLMAEELETQEIMTEPEQTEDAGLNIYAFLPENTAKLTEEIITVDAPPHGYNNPDGTRAKMQLRKISFDKINEITRQYQKRKMLMTKKGRVATTDRGRVAYDEVMDGTALTNALIAEALVHPNLKDQRLLKSYGVVSPEAVVPKMFPTQEAYLYMSELITEHVIGVRASEDELIDQAKN